MKTLTLLIAFTGLISFTGLAQNQFDIHTIQPDKEYDNIHVKKLSSSDDASSFVIWVKKGVKPHKHNHHTEHVYIIDGEGTFYLDGKKTHVKKGDWIFIPKGAVHAVKTTSDVPMKVISVQSPKFEGKDREFVESLNW